MQNAAPCLSRSAIEKIARACVSKYKEANVPQHHLCYRVDPALLAQMLGVRVQYLYLSRDGSILGQTASSPIWTTVFSPSIGETYYYLDGKTILIDKSLLTNPCLAGRRNFTIAHELAHLMLNRLYPQTQDARPRLTSVYRKGGVTDWYEWQADALAAALLMPQDALEQAMFLFGLGSKMKVLSRKYAQRNYENFSRMAEFLQVSKSALAYRMEQLGLLERNCLIREAQHRKGVA